ncbi:cytochrome P450 family protein [Cavenderia fasciculata]|uniref:Cytochrome P450 family protein n=1 Tax=Cavenderia fasciculata TaxID=261658 RepID=F4QFS4_CACFS|nr:cytochrome P450 family protein [Cavenderia fasciculata]EGG14321.1 cytochrome P450 family protein [Cavenderia fasciculata]|eukprot:XP_004351030.1 cytochrome P450 family protein [Cavenderia fasciculata]
MGTIESSLILTICIFWFYYLYKKRNSYLPPGPTPFPIVGNLLSLNVDPHIKLLEFSKRYGGIFTVYMGSIPTVVMNDPEYLREIFVLQSEKSIDRYLSTSALIIGDNQKDFLFSNGDYWKRYRFILANTFSKLRHYPLIMEKVSNEALTAVKSLENHLIINPQEFFKTYTLNVTTLILYGDRNDYHTDEKSFVIDAVTIVEKELSVGNVADLLPFLEYFFRGSRDKLVTILQKLWDYSEKSIHQHKKKLENDPSKIEDLVDLFLTEIKKSEDPEYFTNGLIKVCSDLLLSGTETSASTLSWLFLFLINNPNYQEKVYDELVACQADTITLKHRNSTPFLNACMKETLRIRPVGALSLPRRATEDICVKDKYIIPKGTQLIMNLYGVCNDEKYWKEPTVFNPYRWLSDDGLMDENSTNDKYLPFGIGSRSCVGSSLAKEEMYLIAANILLKYKCHDSLGRSHLDEHGVFSVALAPQPFDLKLTCR